jgi:hypothetical protein
VARHEHTDAMVYAAQKRTRLVVHELTGCAGVSPARPSGGSNGHLMPQPAWTLPDAMVNAAGRLHVLRGGGEHTKARVLTNPTPDEAIGEIFRALLRHGLRVPNQPRKQTSDHSN